MYTICYIVFFVLSTAAAFKNDKGNQMHFTDNQTRYTLPLFITACSHTTKMQKTGYSFCYALFFMAESEGFFGVLPYSFASLRSLTTDFQTVHRTVFIGKADRPCSNPLLSYQQKNKGYSKRYTLYSWRRARDSAHFVRPRVCSANYPIIDFF